MVLADSILSECQRVARESRAGGSEEESKVGKIWKMGWGSSGNWWQSQQKPQQLKQKQPKQQQQQKEEGAAVVAVLGMAHLNGVKKLLLASADL